jgi:hydroxymethylpyrimidine pyrophosphatase-like HAD family hydrolase
MNGFIKTSTIRHIAYEPSHLNHILKDDALYISYERSIKKEEDKSGLSLYKDYDFILSGSDIIRVLNSIDTYGTQNIKPELHKVKAGVNKKIEWFKENYPEDYYRIFQTRDSIDIFKCDQFK